MKKRRPASRICHHGHQRGNSALPQRGEGIGWQNRDLSGGLPVEGNALAGGGATDWDAESPGQRLHWGLLDGTEGRRARGRLGTQAVRREK